jgi:hypothetical protein
MATREVSGWTVTLDVLVIAALSAYSPRAPRMDA